MKWHRDNPKTEKGLSELQKMKIMYDTLMEKIDKIALQPLSMPVGDKKPTFDGIIPQVAEKPKIRLKRTPVQWVELKRDCCNADDYAKWLDDLENDPYLTKNEKSQIKQTT